MNPTLGVQTETILAIFDSLEKSKSVLLFKKECFYLFVDLISSCVFGIVICVWDDFGPQTRNGARCLLNHSLWLVNHFVIANEKQYGSSNLVKLFFAEYGGKRVTGATLDCIDRPQPRYVFFNREVLPYPIVRPEKHLLGTS